MLNRILVIDDEVHSRTVLASTLSRLGFDVRTAENGRTGMKLFTAEPADLVITAIFMPDQEGIETIIELKRSKWPPKVIAVSGPGLVCKMDVLALAQRVGADAVMARPLSISALIETARRLLDEMTTQVGVVGGGNEGRQVRAA